MHEHIIASVIPFLVNFFKTNLKHPFDIWAILLAIIYEYLYHDALIFRTHMTSKQLNYPFNFVLRP